MRIVVTGGHGLLGVPVVSELARSGHEVTVLDVREGRTPRGVRAIVGSHHEIDDLRRAFDGADCVCHMSTLGHAPDGQRDVYGLNVEGAQNVFAAAYDVGVRRVIYWGSIDPLGWSLPGNSFVPEYLPIDEDHPLHPVGPYARSKAEGEEIARSYAHEHGIEALTLRLVFAPSPLQLMHMWKMGGRRHGRYNHYSYVEATDQARAARLAVEAEYHGYEAFHIAADDSCAPEPLSRLLPRLHPEIGDKAAALTGTKSAIANDRAKQKLGWAPVKTWRSPPLISRGLYPPAFAAWNATKRVSPRIADVIRSNPQIRARLRLRII